MNAWHARRIDSAEAEVEQQAGPASGDRLAAAGSEAGERTPGNGTPPPGRSADRAPDGSPPGRADEEKPRPPHGPAALIAALVVADVAFAFQQSAIVPAVQAVRSSFGAGQAWAAWLVTVYLVVATFATPAMGRLGDMYGRRRLMLIGMAVFAVGSLGAAFAPDIAALIVFRAVQGVGGAVYPLSLALARETLPKDRVNRMVALLTGAFGAGTLLGFAAGGLLAQLAGWRWIFGAGALLVTLGGAGIAAAVPAGGASRRDPRERGGFDLLGTAVLALSAGTLLTALTLVPALGWANAAVAGLLAVAVGTAAWWWRLERGRTDPLVDLSALRHWPVLRAHLGAVGLGWSLFGAYLLVPAFLRAGPATAGYGFGYQAAGIGLALLPLAAGQLIGGAGAERLTRRLGVRAGFAASLLLLAATQVLLAVVRGGLPLLVPVLFVFGLGAGVALESSSAAATEGVHGDGAASSSALNSTVRRLAGGIGGQVNTILLLTLTVAAGSDTARFTAVRTAYLIAAVLCLFGAALGLRGGAGRAERSARSRPFRPDGAG